jgi:hypothetical protein
MLDKILTGENVKVNGEIAGRRHILRTLYTSKINYRRLKWFVKQHQVHKTK